MLTKCPRWHYISLVSKDDQRYSIETRCKSWSCRVCRKIKMNEVRTKMEYGCLTVGRFYLITVTGKPEDQWTTSADSAGKALAELLRRLKVTYPRKYKKMKWFKIVELTKQGIPHFHMILGNLGINDDGEVPVDSCVKKDKSGNKMYSMRWLRRHCRCISHDWSKMWFELTGMSFIVDVVEGYNVGGSVAYLIKYLEKSFLHRRELMELGFERRYSSSRNWPSEPRSGGGIPPGERWKRIEIYGRDDRFGFRQEEIERAAAHNVFNQSRSELGDNIREKRKRKGQIADMEKKMKRLGV